MTQQPLEGQPPSSPPPYPASPPPYPSSLPPYASQPPYPSSPPPYPSSPPPYASQPPPSQPPPSQPPPYTGAPVYGSPPPPPPTSRSRTGLIVAIVAAVVLVAGGVTAAVLLTGGGPKNGYGAYCDVLKKADQNSALKHLEITDPTAMQTASDVIKGVAAKAPTELDADWAVISGYFQALASGNTAGLDIDKFKSAWNDAQPSSKKECGVDMTILR